MFAPDFDAPPRPRTQTITGYRAVRAALDHRLGDVERLFYAAEHAMVLRPWLKQLAERRATFRELPAPELEKAGGGRAHQGLVAVLRWPDVPPLTRELVVATAQRPGVTVLLDGVGNPHNLGAIARTAAFLGVAALWLPAEVADAMRSAAVYRTAEGGLETVPVLGGPAPLKVVQAFVDAGGTAVALTVRGRGKLADLTALRGQAVLLVLGSEEFGLERDVETACPLQVRIAGTDRVESLNVGVAAGIALAALVGG